VDAAGDGPPSTADAAVDVNASYLPAAALDRLLAEHPVIARRWLHRVTQRISASQQRILGLLGVGLWQQTARLRQAPCSGRRLLLPTTQRWAGSLPWGADPSADP
jgi:CRP-like cAMP-binding protein